ncbi:gas vesicle protein K [Metabacillus idriensis]|uniref:Gas vesicle protein K n=1 Tax=Metabacillus idriensis TaxID=324768 RepID=A0A6I2MH06_9BACI|nr:gas vesicle protein K [Metabacillus idriensis]MCM3596037.1 gas vesicle protein K [Metabacillus idriensis]MDR0137815.1 gas vesicle protein K [Metabacillus idriensis]MRX56644.1 gas vesicle protein K [Metabacillus idriensis]OHR64107.1 gas vesicle protein GvpK [Bacillus sp. HMSC76G11]
MQQANGTNGRIQLDPDNAEQGLAQLVLTIIELLRQIVERHAMRRVEGGTLTDEQIENLGVALMNLEDKMEELKEIFGLDAEDLNIDLGPLGNLL